jgi:hypothetical protein
MTIKYIIEVPLHYPSTTALREHLRKKISDVAEYCIQEIPGVAEPVCVGVITPPEFMPTEVRSVGAPPVKVAASPVDANRSIARFLRSQ